MSWKAIEDYLFDRYCVEGIDRELAALFERHDEEIRNQVRDEFATKSRWEEYYLQGQDSMDER